MFNQGYWQKNHNLWVEVQKAKWSDVILKEERKAAIQKDVTSFFKSEALYKELGIPWKVDLLVVLLKMTIPLTPTPEGSHYVWPSR